MTDRYVVIGNPVDHSLSPDIHRAFAEQTGERLEYSKLPAPLDGFAAALGGFFDEGGLGASVTVPFKEQAHAWVDRCDPLAAASESVNTVAREDGGTVGYNTDGIGLLRDLCAIGVDLKGSSLLLLGAGGAARGILGSLLEAGVDRLVIANRTVERAETLAGTDARVSAHSLQSVEGPFDLVVNATSAGLQGEGALVDPAAVRGAICYDLFYGRDGATPFCRWAGATGASEVADGLGMLVEQAAAQFEIWRGVRPETRPVLATLRR